MTKDEKKDKRFIYRQSIANLELEGLSLSRAAHKLVLKYQSGALTHSEFINRTLAYVRSR